MVARDFYYRDHRMRVAETAMHGALVWTVQIDQKIIGGEPTEPAAMAMAYAAIDQMIADAELMDRLIEARCAPRHDVQGPGFDPEVDDVGDPFWVHHRGRWVRGIVTRAWKAIVEVAFVGPNGRKVQRRRFRMDAIVRAR